MHDRSNLKPIKPGQENSVGCNKIPKKKVMQFIVRKSSEGAGMAVSSNMKAARKDKPLEVKKLLIKYLKIYCKRSTVHGVRYIFDHDLTKVERLCWTAIIIAAVVVSLSSFKILSQAYSDQVILTVVDNSQYPVFNVLFPAVAVCNHERINWNKFEEAKSLFLPQNSPNETQVIFYEFVTRMETLRFGDFAQFNNTEDIPLEKINFINVTELALFLSFSCEELFDGDCFWRGEAFNCCEIFVLEKTEVGFCLVFNSAISYASRKKLVDDKFYPWRNSKSGEDSGLNFQLKLNATSRNMASKDDGVDLMIKKAEQWTDVVYSIKGNTYTLVVIRAELKTTDPNTREIPPEVRGCMFDSETDHYLYKNIKGLMYLQWNCFTVCHEEFLLKLCNCTVSMFFPQNDSNRECAPADYKCLYQYRDVFSYDKRLHEEKYVHNTQGGMLCPCLVRCEDALQYFVTLSSLPLVEPISSNSSVMIIDVHYQTDAIIKYRTIREFTFMEMIATLGGIVGLFLGASIVSGIEIIYHLTIGLFIFLKDNHLFEQIWARVKTCCKIRPRNKIYTKKTKTVWHESSNKRQQRY